MGQNQSSEKEKQPSSRGGTPHNDKTDRDRKVNRRISVQALQRSQPADASPSTVAAQGNTTSSSHNLDMTNLEKILQSNSPEYMNKPNRVEGSSSKGSKHKKQTDAPATPQSLPAPGPPTSVPNSIDIPANSTLASRNRQDDLDEAVRPAYEERTYIPVSHHRPPRLPLPIAEVQTPDSPSLLPVDKNDDDVPIFATDPNDTSMPRRNSMLSVATQEEEEDVGEELQPYGVGYTGQTVPTTIEWHGPAEKVFVTGTFAAWDRKYRLKRSDSTGYHKVVLNLCPGTHHLKFFVDNNMITSPDLPTAVDFNNILVNYIEISHDDIPKQRRESGAIPTKAQPLQVNQIDDVPGEDRDREQYSGTVTPGANDSPLSHSSSASEIPIDEMPEGDFRQLTPNALLDIDNPEDDPKYKQAAQVISDGAGPPSLPLFLSRSILNGNLPVKDDSSVLALPNHTVLNHLMTSNVRNGVLATSVTTRYKKKYVTTISFKPVPKPKPQAVAP